MNDREALERTLASLIYCPTCHHPISSGEHDGTCWLGKHLHPETVQGSAEWADAQYRAGKWVRRRSWSPNRRVRFDAREWFDVRAPWPGIYEGDDWELYVEPTPVEGSAAWAEEVGKKEWVEGLVEYGQPFPPRKFYDGKWRYRDGRPALLSPTECSCAVGWRIWTPPEPDPAPDEVRWPIERATEGLIVQAPLLGEPKPCRLPLSSWGLTCGAVVSGYRLDHFKGTTTDGRTVNMGSLVKVWVCLSLLSPDDIRDYVPGNVVSWYQVSPSWEPVWASVAVMERVQE